MSAKIDGTNGLLQQYDYQVLTTGFSYTFTAGMNALVINPAGTLAAGTITMPVAPVDGMTITFSSTKTITALTLSGNTGQTVVSAVTTLPANQATTYVYRDANTTWYPLSTVATNVPVAPAGGSIITSGTAVASTSGTSIDFTGIPSWVKRITVMLSGVSLSTTASNICVRIGSGSFEATGYVAGWGLSNSVPAAGSTAFTTSFGLVGLNAAADTIHGSIILTHMGSNLWAAQGSFFRNGAVNAGFNVGGSKTTSGTLDRVQVVLDSTGAFDAGTINILYE